MDDPTQQFSSSLIAPTPNDVQPITATTITTDSPINPNVTLTPNTTSSSLLLQPNSIFNLSDIAATNPVWIALGAGIVILLLLNSNKKKRK